MPKLGKVTEQVLRRMVENRDTEDGELVNSGGDWWIGNSRTSGKVGYALLRYCLIKPCHGKLEGAYVAYEATFEAELVLSDPNYVPIVISAMKKMTENILSEPE